LLNRNRLVARWLVIRSEFKGHKMKNEVTIINPLLTETKE
jgi:hypothetical protein